MRFEAQWEPHQGCCTPFPVPGNSVSMRFPLAICVCMHSIEHSRALTLGRASLTSKEPRQKSVWIRCAVASPLTSTHYQTQPADAMPGKAARLPLLLLFSSMEISFSISFFSWLSLRWPFTGGRGNSCLSLYCPSL